jgi:small subunit ribosomal protein S17
MASQQARDIGIEVAPPRETCTDPHCPFHGTLSVRGMVVDGVVASTKMERSVVVERQFLRYVPKYERYEKRTRRFTAHHPPCIALQSGDEVTIMECRPISKTKSFVVVEARKGRVKVVGEDVTAQPRETKEAREGREAGAATGERAAGSRSRRSEARTEARASGRAAQGAPPKEAAPRGTPRRSKPEADSE